MARPSLKGLQSVMTPGMLGTGGFDPATDPLGLALHGRAQAHEDAYYAAQHDEDQLPGTDPQTLVAHQTNEARNRINNMNAGGMGDWLYAFNEATGGKASISTPTHRGDPMAGLPDAPMTAPSTFAPGQDSAVDPHAAAVGLRTILDRRNNPQYYTDLAPSLSGLSGLTKKKAGV